MSLETSGGDIHFSFSLSDISSFCISLSALSSCFAAISYEDVSSPKTVLFY